MKSNIYLPIKVKVGFNRRVDTYSNYLGFIIPYDEVKKSYRQEPSWESWREKYVSLEDLDEIIQRDYNVTLQRYPSTGSFYDYKNDNIYRYRNLTQDTNLIPKEFDNVLMEGFVLNKKAGGERNHYNTRQTVCRVYDPRGFEFEIGIDNLLYILENTNSIVGKGLEGKFIYGWAGTKLVLLPENCPDYEKMKEFTSLQKIKSLVEKDLEVGVNYQTKRNVIYCYLGKFDIYGYSGKEKKSKHWFCSVDKDNKVHFIQTSSLTTFVRKLDPNPNYIYFMSELGCHPKYNPQTEREELVELVNERDYSRVFAVKYKGVVRNTNCYFSDLRRELKRVYPEYSSEFENMSQDELLKNVVRYKKSFVLTNGNIAKYSYYD